jgi:hypothetical protein
MLPAPASIPATTLPVLATGHGESTLRCSPTRSCSPADSANRSSGTRPAEPTRFGSSKTGVTV